MQVIQNVVAPQVGYADWMLWQPCKTAPVSMKSYNRALDSGVFSQFSIKKLWDIQGPSKVGFSAGEAVWGQMPTNNQFQSWVDSSKLALLI